MFTKTSLLSYIQTYSGIFRSYSDISSQIVAYLEHCVTLAYSQPCRIQNPGIFSTSDTCRTLPKYILVYSERRVRLAYSELCHIQKGPEAYSEPCQTSKMEGLTKLVKTYNYSFSKVSF